MSGWNTCNAACWWGTTLAAGAARALRFLAGRGGALEDEDYRARFGGFGKYIHQLPDSYRRLRDGEDLSIGGRTCWRDPMIELSTRSPEHACTTAPSASSDLGRPGHHAHLANICGRPPGLTQTP